MFHKKNVKGIIMKKKNLLPILFLFITYSAIAEDCKPKIWYEDLDNDSFGNSLISKTSCIQPDGYVLNSRDCNDNPSKRGTIFFPGAKEPCHYDDYNCDGKVNTKCELAPLPIPITPQIDLEIIESFQKGHLFKTNKVGSHNLNDPSDGHPELDLPQSSWIKTGGDGLAKTLKAVNLGPYDFSSQMLKIWFKVDNVNHLKDFSIYLGKNNLKYFVRFNLRSTQGQKWTTEGDWTAMAISWSQWHISQANLPPNTSIEEFKKSITDIQLKIVDDRITPVTLHVNRISTVEIPHQKYPHGVISITFDDGWETQYSIAKKKMDQYFFPATAYIIVGFLDTPNFLTTKQLKKLQYLSQWEIGFHAFDPIMHLSSYTHFPPAMVERDIQAGRQWLWENGFGLGQHNNKGIAHFAYPKGEFKRPGLTDVKSLSERYFTSSRSISEKTREVWGPSDPHKLRVIYITAPESVESIIDQIDKGIAAKEWIILVLHHLVEQPVLNDQWEISKFRTLIDYLGKKAHQTPVRTVGDVLSEIP
jgi:hypothetical protein